MKSIKGKIRLGMISTIIISMVILGIVSISMNFSSSMSMLKTSIEGTSSITASRIEKELTAYKYAAGAVGSVARLSNPTIPLSEKQQLIDTYAKQYNMIRGNLLDLNGDSLFDGNNYSDREYFQHALNGECYVSTPVRSSVTNELTVIVAAPLWKDGVPSSEVVGVVYLVPDENFLNDIVASVHITDNSAPYIIDKDGNTIADPDASVVCNQNIENEATSDSSLETLANYHSKMRQGESGVGEYKINGVAKLLAYAPIEETDGWSLGIGVPKSDLMGPIYTGAFVTAVIIVIAILVGLYISVRLSHAIGKPVEDCVKRIALLAKGDLKTPMPQIKSNDETGRLVKETDHIVKTLHALIEDIKYLLSKMADGDFTVKSKNESYYVGDYKQLLPSIKQITGNLSDILSQIHVASDQVAIGADQVANGSQALAQGATEQASAVEELSATIGDIESSSKKTADISLYARNVSNEAGGKLQKSSEAIINLSKIMKDISSSSQEISKIISTIEDIAFQTNILALNAAVEAARAGEAGKGFAVVADEVRNLASKSDQAAKATKQLIEKSVVAVEGGSEMMENVITAVEDVLASAGKAVSSMEDVSKAVQEQYISISQITQGTEQIASVVQTNSATAEESAAASEELSGQAEMLKNLVSKFKLN